MTLPANSCLCWDRISCEQCGCFDRPMGYTDNRSGAFHHVCQQCGHQWVAISAEDERAAAEGRVNDALNTRRYASGRDEQFE